MEQNASWGGTQQVSALPRPQESATDFFPELDESNPQPQTLFP